MSTSTRRPRRTPLKAAILADGRSQREIAELVAKRLGVPPSPSSFSRVVNGLRASDEFEHAVSAVLKVKRSDLFR